jgi:hypothetical protein
VAVSESGALVVVGEPLSDAGAVFVFTCTASEGLASPANVTCALLQPLSASDAADGDRFGAAVAISGSTVIVGSPYKSVNGSFQGGGPRARGDAVGTDGQQARRTSLAAPAPLARKSTPCGSSRVTALRPSGGSATRWP